MLTAKGAMSCSVINTLLIAAQIAELEPVVVKGARAVLWVSPPQQSFLVLKPVQD